MSTISLNQDITKSESPDQMSGDYDLNKPQLKWELPSELLEISGITIIDKDYLLVIEDEHSDLYILKLDNSKASIDKKICFETDGKKLDLEDVAICNNTAYTLSSHGDIYEIKNWNNIPEVKVINTFLSKDNNTEGICFDPVTKNLLIACKNKSKIGDEKKSTRTIYEFDVEACILKTEPFLLIHMNDIMEMTKEKIEFFPSALDVHPVTHDIYILSTRDTKCMAVYSHEGTLKSFQLINKDILPQPEGICFTPDGTLYISSESKHDAPALIVQFNK